MSHDEANAALVIGLVNNMPDGALKATERQFHDLLAAAAGNSRWRLRRFSLPEAARSEATQAYINENYEKFDALWSSRLDGLIVTGTEPRTPALANEPYWGTLTRLVDWAEQHTRQQACHPRGSRRYVVHPALTPERSAAACTQRRRL